MNSRFYISLLLAAASFTSAFAQDRESFARFANHERLSKSELQRLHGEFSDSDSKLPEFIGDERSISIAAIVTGGIGTALIAILAVNANHVVNNDLIKLSYTERMCLKQPARCMEMIERIKHEHLPAFEYEHIVQREYPGIRELAQKMGFDFSSIHVGDGQKKMILRYRDIKKIKNLISIEQPTAQFDMIFHELKMATVELDFEEGLRFLNLFSNIPKNKLPLAMADLLDLYRRSTAPYITSLVQTAQKKSNLERLPVQTPEVQRDITRHKMTMRSEYESIEQIKERAFSWRIVSHDRNINLSQYRLELKGYRPWNPIVRWYRNLPALQPKLEGVRLKKVAVRLGIFAAVMGAGYLAYEYLGSEKQQQPRDEVAMAMRIDALMDALDAGDWESVDAELSHVPELYPEIHQFYQEYQAYKRLMN